MATLTGDATANTLSGDSANDSIVGAGGNDTLIGAGGNDTIKGDAGVDQLSGGTGNDQLEGGADADVLSGGDGDDYLSGGAGNDTLDGGGHSFSDSANYLQEGAGVNVNLATGTATDGGGGTDSLIGIEQVWGSAHNDTLVGDAGDNYFQGNAGSDVISGGGGNDIIDHYNATSGVGVNLASSSVTDGHGGTDTISGIEGVWGGSHNDTLIGDNSANGLGGRDGNDTLDGQDGNDTLSGGAGDDVISGGIGRDLLSGGTGNDTITAGPGEDHINGGDGNDLIFVHTGPSGNNASWDYVAGSRGSDTINVGGGAFSQIEYTGLGTNSISVTFNNGEIFVAKSIDNSTDTITSLGTTADGGSYMVGGSNGADTFTHTLANLPYNYIQLRPNSGNDTINANDDPNGMTTLVRYDKIDGQDIAVNVNLGGDSSSSGTATYTVGGTGYTDTLIGVSQVRGGSGNDTLAGSSITNMFQPRGGNDQVDGGDYGLANGGSERDLLRYSTATSSINIDLTASPGGLATGLVSADGFGGQDTIFGTFERFRLGNSNDTFRGEETSELVTGGGGDDLIIGNGGTDTLSGGGGADTLSGGAGNDIFFAGDGDTVADFTSGDRIMLSGVTGLTASALTVTSNQIAIDTNGDNSADITLTTTGINAGQSFDVVTVSGSAEIAFPGTGTTITTPPPSTGGGSGGGSGAGSGGGTGDGTGGGLPGPITTITDNGGLTQTTNTQIGTDGVTRATSTFRSPTGEPTTAPVTVSISGNLSTDLPSGVGLAVTGPSTAQVASSAQTELTNQINSLVSDAADQTRIQQKISEFTAGLGATDTVTVQTVTPSVTTGSVPGAPIALTGNADSGTEALIVDVTNLPAGTPLTIDNIEFVSFVGNVAVTLTGGSGSNYVVLGSGSDNVILGADDDTLQGGDGNDMVGSMGGNDILYGNQGTDTVTGGADQDSIFGGQDQDVAYGNTGNDIVYGNKGDDTLYGGQDNDTLYGGQDNDTIHGNSGNDEINGNKGNDTLIGEAGADTFVFSSNGGTDTISDYASGDIIRIENDINSTGIDEFSDLNSRVSYDSAGNAVLDLGDGNNVTLSGVSSSDLGDVTVEIYSGGSLLSTGALTGTITTTSTSTTDTDAERMALPGDLITTIGTSSNAIGWLDL